MNDEAAVEAAVMTMAESYPQATLYPHAIAAHVRRVEAEGQWCDCDECMAYRAFLARKETPK